MYERNKYDTMPLEKYKKVNNAYIKLLDKPNSIEHGYTDTGVLSQEKVFDALTIGIDVIISDCEIDEE